MSVSTEQASATLAPESGASLPPRKRKAGEAEASEPNPSKVTKTEDTTTAKPLEPKPAASSGGKVVDPATLSKSRVVRLEQNRKAARESRRRKKVMIEELQRSVIFFSRANGTLKQRNDELTRLLMQCKIQAAALEGSGEGAKAATSVAGTTSEPATTSTQASEQAQANAVAAQALLESQGFPSAAARAAAQTMNAGAVTASVPEVVAPTLSSPSMQPGATMQAMANFQQAAAAAMQSAMGQMQAIPGVNMTQLAAAPAGTNAQQAYTDTMTAIAMQQAAAAAASSIQKAQAAESSKQGKSEEPSEPSKDV